MTIRPEMMCRPPANRSIDDTSALRQHGLVTLNRLSSSLTCAVSAMRVILPPSCAVPVLAVLCGPPSGPQVEG